MRTHKYVLVSIINANQGLKSGFLPCLTLDSHKNTANTKNRNHAGFPSDKTAAKIICQAKMNKFFNDFVHLQCLCSYHSQKFQHLIFSKSQHLIFLASQAQAITKNLIPLYFGSQSSSSSRLHTLQKPLPLYVAKSSFFYRIVLRMLYTVTGFS